MQTTLWSRVCRYSDSAFDHHVGTGQFAPARLDVRCSQNWTMNAGQSVVSGV
jgi:hypothetical protein